MTKFQRGELMEGWNDLPEGFTATSGQRRRRTHARPQEAPPPKALPAFQFTPEEMAATKTKLQLLVALLPEEDKSFYEKRVILVYDLLDEKHRQFVTYVVSSLDPKEDIRVYMTKNSNTSVWCMPLKKLLEATK